jgi:hypothetical protein
MNAKDDTTTTMTMTTTKTKQQSGVLAAPTTTELEALAKILPARWAIVRDHGAGFSHRVIELNEKADDVKELDLN